MQIANEGDAAAAGRRIRELLDRNEPAEAIAFAESSEGPKHVTDQLRALAYTHAGAMLQDRERLESAAELWRSAGAETHNAIGYNLANTELDLWHLLVRERGYVPTLQDDRAHLRDARGLLRRAGHDATLPLHIRIQALLTSATATTARAETSTRSRHTTRCSRSTRRSAWHWATRGPRSCT